MARVWAWSFLGLTSVAARRRMNLAPVLWDASTAVIFSVMGFRIISGTATQEFVENVESATAAGPLRAFFLRVRPAVVSISPPSRPPASSR